MISVWAGSRYIPFMRGSGTLRKRKISTILVSCLFNKAALGANLAHAVYFHTKAFRSFLLVFIWRFRLSTDNFDFAHVLTYERYLKELKEVFLFMSGIIAIKSEEIGESILICMAKHISGLLRRSDQKVKSYMALACECVFECDYSPLVKCKWKDEERRLTCFEYTFGTHLDMSSLTEVELSSAKIRNVGAAVISVVLEKNSSLHCNFQGVIITPLVGLI